MRRARRPPISNRIWLPESATEWTDSASMDEDPDTRNAMNLVMAMPTFANSAAMIALVPPSALTWWHPSRLSLQQTRLERRDRVDGRRVDAFQHPEVHAGEVADGAQACHAFQRVFTHRHQQTDRNS